MSQHDYNLADQAGAAFRADLNSALAAIVSQNSGATEPAATFAYQWWADTTSGRLKQRNAANSAWLDRGPLAAVYATFGELVKFVKGADIASAATVDLGTATGNTVDVTHSTGTTAITSLGGASLQAGTEIETRFVISGGTLTLTHHATNLYLAGGANITLANGDVIRWRKMHSSNAEWKMVGGVKANGTAWATSMSTARLIGRTTAGTGAQEEISVGSGLSLSAGSLTATGSGITLGTPVASTSGTSIDFTSIPAGTKRITINFAGVSTSGTSNIMIQIGDSGGIETSGYIGGTSNQGGGSAATFSAGYIVTTPTAAADTRQGTIVLSLENSTSNTWCEIGTTAIAGTTLNYSAGYKTLSPGPLDRVRITTVGGTDTFDAGEINITYES